MCRVLGEEVLCAKGTSWLTRHGEHDAGPFFNLLRASPTYVNLQLMTAPFCIQGC